jgi:hypothetical protein
MQKRKPERILEKQILEKMVSISGYGLYLARWVWNGPGDERKEEEFPCNRLSI